MFLSHLDQATASAKESLALDTDNLAAAYILFKCAISNNDNESGMCEQTFQMYCKPETR